MKTSAVYAVLARELETIRQLPAPQLIDLLNKPTRVKIIELCGEEIELEFCFAWQEQARRSIRIIAHARGPSTWRQEHLQESISITLPANVVPSKSS